jgi:hypothetical protein
MLGMLLPRCRGTAAHGPGTQDGPVLAQDPGREDSTMSTRRRLLARRLPALATVLLLSGCLPSPTSEGGFGTDGADAARESAYYLATSIGLEVLAWGVQRSRGPGAPDETTSSTYERTRTCELGGAIDSSVQETIHTDVDPARAVVDLQATDVHQGCILRSGSSEVSVTGSPQVTSTVHAASMAGQLWGTQSVTLVGGVWWSSPGGSDSFCKLNFRIIVDGPSQTTVGEVCGFHIDVTAISS